MLQVRQRLKRVGGYQTLFSVAKFALSLTVKGTWRIGLPPALPFLFALNPLSSFEQVYST